MLLNKYLHSVVLSSIAWGGGIFASAAKNHGTRPQISPATRAISSTFHSLFFSSSFCRLPKLAFFHLTLILSFKIPWVI